MISTVVRTVSLVVLTGLLGAVAPADVGASASQTAPALGTASSEYVALGDSYAAGYGLGDPTGEPTAACGQSADDYPHRVAETLGLDLTDVTCAGATTDDVLTARQHDVAPQIGAVGDDTGVVTITIGGNDSGLFGTATSCFAFSANGPVVSGQQAADCRSGFTDGGDDAVLDRVHDTVATGVARTVRAVHRAAPRALVVVVGYLAIFPDAAHTPSGGCFRPAVGAEVAQGRFPSNAFPFTDADVPYLHHVQRELDDVTRDVVESNGAEYVSVLDDSLAHTPCARQGAYVHGVELSASSSLDRIDLVPSSLHPNEAGAAVMADAAVDGIREAARAAAASTPPSPGAEPSGPLDGVPPALVWPLALGVVVALALVVVFLAARRRRAIGRRERPGSASPDHDR
ncbi:SGNH/GDSL hydrolase family protein [Curtobacterium sp. MCSS17_008]|uniref:SGNH/GDSL hydrolase family protein n=1 Tax=Curtobacterium sp. MCSS17_008 TaxID=2175647 RepID=UPI0015E8AE74|nr:SGNH/GDSL hydrolase family protein [Curtobacterium sp. MCSS17_008]